MRRLIKSLLFSVLSLTMAIPAFAAEIDTAEVDRRIQRLMDRPEMAGLAVAIVENGEVIFAKGYGETQKGSKNKVTPDTVFRWASLSKGVAAAAVLQLAEKGQIELQSPAVFYAPSLALPESHYDATLEDVLAQRTGLASNAYDTKIEDGRAAKFVRASLKDVRRACEPGACHSYQNAAFDAAAEAVETVSGLPYKTVVHQNIFAPLGMTTGSVTLEALNQSSNWARPHNKYGAEISKVKPTYYRIPAAAGVNSSVTDLAKWMTAQMPESEGLSDYVRESMQEPRIVTLYENRKMRRHYGSLRNARYGLGWRIYDYGSQEVIGHRGAVSGYRANILFDPSRKTGIAILWNSNFSRPNGLALEVMDQVYGNSKKDWMRLGPETLFAYNSESATQSGSQ